MPSSRLAELETRRRPIHWRAALFIGLIVLALLALESWSRFVAYQTAVADAQVASANIARATADHAESTLNLTDAIIWGLVERVEVDGTSGPAGARLHQVMMARIARAPALQGLFVYDEHGAWVVNSLVTPMTNVNNADREYFLYHRNHAERGAHVGPPIQSRSSGKWVLPVSRRLQHPDGSFAGVVLATVRIDFFQSFYNEFQIGKDGVILLTMAEGKLVSRRPLRDGMIGSDLVAGALVNAVQRYGVYGTAMLVSSVDQVERLYSFHPVKTYPLVVATALSKQEILAPWTNSSAIEAVAILVLIAMILFAGRKLYLQVVIRDRLEYELRVAQRTLQSNNASLHELALTDGLTGLSNRRHLDDKLAEEFARAARTRAPLAMIMIDVDHFKLFNDLYGHAVGDQCLRAVARMVGEASKRPGDIAARFGGEEFAILLPGATLGGARAIADALCLAINDMCVPHSASPHKSVSVSLGVYALIPAQGQSAETLIEMADKGLYLAKAGGRNRVETYWPQG